MKYPNRIKELRLERGLGQADIYRQLGWGEEKGNSRFSLLENGHRKLTLKHGQQIAAILGVTVGELTEALPQRFQDNQSPALYASEHIYKTDQWMIPSYGTSVAAESKIMGLGTTRAMGRVDMRQMKDAFAVMVAGNSMEPRYRQGDYALVVPEWPQPYQDCLVETQDGEGFVKIYVSTDGDRLICKHLFPKEEKWEMPLKKIKNVQLVRGRWK